MHTKISTDMRQMLPIVLPAVIVMTALSVVAWLFASRATDFMEDALRTYLRTSAALAAQQLDARDIQRVQTARDISSPEFQRLVYQLQEIRRSVFSARFAYIFRRTDDASHLAFVADADALLPDEQIDTNRNGMVDPDEEPGMPGDLYDISTDPMLQGAAFLAPIAGDFYIDQWGELISGYAPIYDHQGKVVAVVGIDMQAEEFRRLARSIISPFVLGSAIFVTLMIAFYVGVLIWRRQIQALKTVADERSALIDLAMHQIGAPLATFRWWTEILEEQDEGRQKPERIDAYNKLKEGIHRMDEVVQALKQANALRHGEIAYKREIAPLHDIVTEVIAKMQPDLTRTGHTITSSVPDGLLVQMDRKLIAGVLHELIANAIAYSPANTTIALHAVVTGTLVLVTVQDEGYGMTPEDLRELFTPFKRGENAMKYKPVGNGMGLFLCRGIIDKSGGSINVESEINKGTIVRFTLPVA